MKGKLKLVAIDYFLLIIASIIGTFSTTALMIPNGLTCGGLTGIVRIVQNFVPIDFSILYYIGAVMILVIVVITMGIREARKVITITIIYPTVLFIMEKIDFQLLEQRDLTLAAIFCGVLLGICNGIVFSRGYAFCGTESIAKILKQKVFQQVSISHILLFLDASIIIASAFIFNRNVALYALVTQMVSTKLVDIVLCGFKTKIVQLSVIMEQPELLKNFVLKEIGRGVSSRPITGEYTNTQKKELVILCSPRECVIIRKFLMEHDPDSFVTILHVDTVWGRGKGFAEDHLI